MGLSRMPQNALQHITSMQATDEATHLNSLIASDCCAQAIGLIQYTQIHQPGMMCLG